MNLEQLAIILEAVSFMLVTTDLYGKERIRNLHRKVGNTLLHLDEFDRTFPTKYLVNQFAWILHIYNIGEIESSFWRVLSGVVLGIVVLGIASYMAVFVTEWPGRSMWGLKNSVDFFFTVMTISCMVFMLPVLIIVLVLGLEGIIVMILTIILIFLEKLNLEGGMLIVGSILFVISKAISYRNASR